jgi:anti-anti-sigma factor
MTIVQRGETVRVSEIEELGARTSAGFQAELARALEPDVSSVELDFGQTRFVDCGGVGALAAARKTARQRNPAVTFRVVNPPASLRRILKVTRMDQVFPFELPEVSTPSRALAANLVAGLS